MHELRIVIRYLAGRPLDGRTGYPYLRRGPGRWPGWRRQLLRVGLPAAAITALHQPRYAGYAAAMLLVAAAWVLRRRWARRRFRRAYIAPTLAALGPPLGGVPVRLHVDPGLGTLTPRLAKPLSPAEERIRLVYGKRVEPVLRWPVETVMRLWWWIQRRARPLTRRLAVFRRPGEQPEPRIQLEVDTPYLTAEQRHLVSAIIGSKVPVADLVEAWDQVGPRVSATWKVRRRPPARVGEAELLDALPRLQEWEYYLGAGPGAAAVTISLHDDSPHIALSAGSGAGKSVLAQLVAVQVLARGGQVVILDRKGSHRWALGLPGVDYCTRPEQMHTALVRLATLANERNDAALYEADGWDPGPRFLAICEELNATIGQLTTHWAAVRDKSDPKRSPAVSALGDLLFMGRSAKVNVLAIAQMLTARSIGGPEARENFGIRCLARFTANAWKMLVPEAAMPRASRTLGRWQVVIGGVATEVQVAYLTAAQARRTASVPGRGAGLDSPLISDVAGNGGQTGNTPTDPITLRGAIDEGLVPWSKDAAKMRLARARRAGRPTPEPVGKHGRQADLYRRADLAAWVAAEQQTTS